MVRTLVGVLLFVSASFAGTSALPMGSLTTFGPVRLSGVTAPSGTTVFSGDTIETGTGGAVLSFGDAAVTLGVNSSVRVSGTQTLPAIELVRGMSRLQVRSKELKKELKLVASNWVVQSNPDAKTGRTTAIVVRDSDGAVSLNVREGELVAKSTAGSAVYFAQAGRPVLLPAHPSAMPPGAPASPPQAGGSGSGSGSSASKAKVIGAYILAAAAVGVGAAAIAGRNDSGDLRGQVLSLSNQNAALQQQAQSLIAQVNALLVYAQAYQAWLNQLLAALSALNAAQANLAAIQVQLNALVAKVASGQALTPAELTLLATLTTQQAAAYAAFEAAAGAAAGANRGAPDTPPLGAVASASK